MGAVQKLATVVIVGLVAFAALLVVYLADEPNRMAAEAIEQQDVAIHRGISTYIANCVICHGPAGEGYSEPGAEGTGRIGMPLGGDTELGMSMTALNQTDDPIEREERYNLLYDTINNGRGLMPAFGTGAEGGALLNPEQIHELVLMIQNVNWNEVYNETIEASGGYPTFPPPPAPAGGAPTPAPAPAGDGEDAGDVSAEQEAAGEAPAAAEAVTITSFDIYFEPSTLTIPANTDVQIILPNEGVTLHNFSITDHNNENLPFDPIDIDIAPGETQEVVLNAPPGEYYFFCDIPGHEAAGMFGTLTVTDEAGGAEESAPAEDAAPADGAPAEEAAQDAAPADAAAPAAAAEPVTVTSFDIYFEPTEVTIPADTDVTFTLPNDGVTLHDFTIDALGVHVEIAPGATEEVVINAPAGTYEYYCSVPGHKAAGMFGTLIVE